ncbi:uncharacterized protein LDX57_006144 [Aspergillus melleus]|uniref:uncharacterized protein n=1 Tax=Aspergillus melleus TaxID=138277 RepID=UPI001E8CEA6A|nr:uncharacterized protein LDX57_006144 [Aspergillus melleus]KAH8428445.1 hypothetical protein LDX57_006144 [Aspergillus melleus]
MRIPTYVSIFLALLVLGAGASPIPNEGSDVPAPGPGNDPQGPGQGGGSEGDGPGQGGQNPGEGEGDGPAHGGQEHENLGEGNGLAWKVRRVVETDVSVVIGTSVVGLPTATPWI